MTLQAGIYVTPPWGTIFSPDEGASPKTWPIRGLGPPDRPVANEMLSRAFPIARAFDLKADHLTVTVTTSEHPDEDEWTRVQLSVTSK